jgi:hypothetical protein
MEEIDLFASQIEWDSELFPQRVRFRLLGNGAEVLPELLERGAINGIAEEDVLGFRVQP